MIDQNGNARLADFGLLTFTSDPSNPTGSNSVTSSGTTRWMSPELLHPQEFGFEQSRPTKKSDCYALGMAILEVLSEEPPFARDNTYVVMRKVVEGERPQRPGGAWFTDGLWGTLEQCWLPQPKDRPTLEVILELLGQASKIWQPLPLIVEDVDADSDESISTTSQGTYLRFIPDPLLTAGKIRLSLYPLHGPRSLKSTKRSFPSVSSKRTVLDYVHPGDQAGSSSGEGTCETSLYHVPW